MKRLKSLLLGVLLGFIGFISITTYMSIPTVYLDLQAFITDHRNNSLNNNINDAERADREQELKDIFIGKNIYYTGKIKLIGRDSYSDDYIIWLINIYGTDKVKCHLDVDDWREEIYTLQKGQTIKIRGKFDRFFLGMSIKNCEIVDMED